MEAVEDKISVTDNVTSEPESLELTILMPCLNEAETLEVCIRKAQEFLRQNEIVGEVLIADNGSTDGSQAIVERMGARLVPVPMKGYGAALMGGIAAAHGRYIIMGDADDSYDFTSLMPFVTKLREGNDLVMGNRFWGGIKPGAMPPLHRYLGNPVLTGIGRLFFQSACRDFHCGLRGFSKEAALRMELRTTGMEFASEMIVKATLNKMSITEVPTILSPDGRSRPPHLRSWRDGWRHLRFLLMYSPRWLFLYPGLLLMIVGLVGMLWLIPGPRNLGGGHILDVHTLLYAAISVIIGFQGVNFAVFTKVFAITTGLFPPDPRMDHLFKYVTLETGLISGLVLLLGGIVGSIAAVAGWARQDFGPLDYSQTLRVIIPSVTALTLGGQIVLSSFFLSILGLPRK